MSDNEEFTKAAIGLFSKYAVDQKTVAVFEINSKVVKIKVLRQSSAKDVELCKTVLLDFHFGKIIQTLTTTYLRISGVTPFEGKIVNLYFKPPASFGQSSSNIGKGIILNLTPADLKLQTDQPLKITRFTSKNQKFIKTKT